MNPTPVHLSPACTLYQGDCLVLMPSLPDHSIDMILCDLPYGTTACIWDIIIPFEPLWTQYKRVIKPNGAIVLTAQTPFDKVLGCSNLPWLRYEWIWQKERGTGFLNAQKAPLKAHENALVFYKTRPFYSPQMKPGKPYTTRYSEHNLASANYKNARPCSKQNVYNGRFPTSILSFARDSKKLHPTQKPVALMEYFIRTYTTEGETVLDNCMGSASTGIACLNTGRKFIGMEQSAQYFEVAQNRLQSCLQEQEAGI